MAFDSHTTTDLSADVAAQQGSGDTSTLWQGLDALLSAFHGARGRAVFEEARDKGMDPAAVLSIELDGPLSCWTYPVLSFGSQDPRESFVFSPQGAFRRFDFLPPDLGH